MIRLDLDSSSPQGVGAVAEAQLRSGSALGHRSRNSESVAVAWIAGLLAVFIPLRVALPAHELRRRLRLPR
jgi:hypothetical protein